MRPLAAFLYPKWQQNDLVELLRFWDTSDFWAQFGLPVKLPVGETRRDKWKAEGDISREEECLVGGDGVREELLAPI